MFSEIVFSCVRFAALVALERPLPSVRLQVLLQSTRTGRSVVAVITLVWLFPCMLPHYVLFQLNSTNAGIIAHCAFVRLFPRVGPFVGLQMV